MESLPDPFDYEDAINGFVDGYEKRGQGGQVETYSSNLLKHTETSCLNLDLLYPSYKPSDVWNHFGSALQGFEAQQNKPEFWTRNPKLRYYMYLKMALHPDTVETVVEACGNRDKAATWALRHVVWKKMETKDKVNLLAKKHPALASALSNRAELEDMCIKDVIDNIRNDKGGSSIASESSQRDVTQDKNDSMNYIRVKSLGFVLQVALNA